MSSSKAPQSTNNESIEGNAAERRQVTKDSAGSADDSPAVTNNNSNNQQQQPAPSANNGISSTIPKIQPQAPTAAQLSSGLISSPKQTSSVGRVGGGISSLPSSASNSPRQIKRGGSTDVIGIPQPPKPPRNITYSSSDDWDNSQRRGGGGGDSSDPGTTPIASPSNLSASSKTTVKTGFGQHKQRQDLQASTPVTIDSNLVIPIYPYANLKTQTRGSVGSVSNSPKMSPMSTSNSNGRKAVGVHNKSSSSSGGASTIQQQRSQQIPQIPQSSCSSYMISHKLDHPPLPFPRKANQCPLFCCFYAEFDNVVGPKICFQSPLGFMEQDTDVSLKKIHKLLATNFDRILAADERRKTKSTGKQQQQQQQQQQERSSEKQSSSDEKKNSVQESEEANDVDKKDPTSSPPSLADANSPQQIKASKSSDSATTYAATNTTGSIRRNRDDSNQDFAGAADNKPTSTSSSLKDTSTQVSNSSAHGSATMQQQNTKGKDAANTASGSGGGSSASIFDSTSDFIITGNELTGNIVNLSAFNMHLLTRPTTIHDNRYERNSLLFCVGFVLRRSEDPRPFRPLLSKLALTMKRMEMESHFLSAQQSRDQIQPLLDRILVSLNCTHWETNLVVYNNVLNLKLFHPPKYPASPVPDHAVPILLRRDWQVQLYDWDLAINWVVLHIDGVANARQISRKAEVDMEMVRNCLRVLKHHGVVSLVDMFFYSNRYESTKKAAAMLAGHESSLLQEAAEYIMKRPCISTIQTTAPPPYSNLIAPISPPTSSPTATLQENFVKPPISGSPSSPIPSSYPPGMSENVTAASLLGSNLKYVAPVASYQTHDPHLFGALRREEQRELKAALAELYCVCNRNLSFGDLWIALASGKGRSQSFDRSAGERGRSNNRNAGETNINANHVARSLSGIRGDSTDADMSGSEDSQENIDPVEMTTLEYYFERLKKKSSCSNINWRNIFDLFDHRRFVSFGLVNGLLERVHCFPCILEPSASISHRKENSFLSNDTGFRRQMSQEDPGRLARNAATMMDGSHCDDDIVSSLEKPINELIDLVEKYEGKKVLPIYSVATEQYS